MTNKKENWEKEFVKTWNWLHDLVDKDSGDPFGEMNELMYEISQLLKQARLKVRREAIRLCSADILRAQEIERTKFLKMLEGLKMDRKYILETKWSCNELIKEFNQKIKEAKEKL